MSENNKKILIGGLVVLVIVVLVAWYFGKGSGVSYKAGGGAAGVGAPGTGGTAGGPVQSATRQSVSSNVTVPDATSTVSSNVAAPKIVTQAAPGSTSKFRSFSLSVTGGKFIPDTVIVNAGDTVHLNITATDKDYDFYQPDYGLSTALPKGVAKVVEFQATSQDKYTFYCQSCGGPSKGPVGYVTVVK